MTPVLEELLDRIEADEPFDYRPETIAAQQLEAANARFETARAAISVLARRAEDAGVEQIKERRDLVPLLFSHTTYKSYPESLVTKKQWPLLARWVDTLSIRNDAHLVDFSGVDDLDGFIDRLQASGQPVFVSSGTTGKCSVFSQIDEDLETSRRIRVEAMRWSTSTTPDRSRPVFILVPSVGRHRMILTFRYLAEAFGRPDATYWLSDRPVNVTDINRMGEIRKQIATGTARPSDVAQFEEVGRERTAAAHDDFRKLADAVVRHGNEPVMVLGLWSQHHALAVALEEQGFTGLHPESAALVAGGLKGAVLPPDYREVVHRVYGISPAKWQENYGMVEGLSQMTACEHGRYHVPPWVVLLVLDRSGEELVEPVEGRLEGRMAYLDLAVSGRWGGIISGDRVVVDLRPCPCGRTGPTVVEITRYADLPEGDDKLTCAGTVDAYIRGAIGV